MVLGVHGAAILTVTIMGRIKYISIFVIFFLLILIFGRKIGKVHEVQTNIATEIQSIPKAERESLEFFFRYAFRFYPLAYTLFGDKPMAYASFARSENFTAYQKERNPLLMFAPLNWMHKRFRKGYEVWEKYRYLFPSSNYLFFDFTDPQTNDECWIFLINKKCFLQAVEENIADFKAILGNDITANQVLEEIQKTKNVFKVLRHKNLLMGILFGYGKHNAELFQKRHDFFKRYPGRRKDCPYQLNPTYRTDTPLNPLMLNPPCFAADLSHPETVGLQQKYHSQRHEILKRYRSGDFLEVTLSQMVCSG